MIFAVTATKEGVKAVEKYAEEGESTELSFLQAVLLTRSTNLATVSEILSMLRAEYPTELSAEAINNAIRKLERQGLVKVTRDVNFDTRVNVRIRDIIIPCKLGDFISSNSRVFDSKINDIFDALKWKGEYSTPMEVNGVGGFVKIELR